MPIGTIEANNVNLSTALPSVPKVRSMFETADKQAAVDDQKKQTVYTQMLKDPKNAAGYAEATGIPISPQMQQILAEPEKAQRVGDALETAKSLGIANAAATKKFLEAHLQNGGNALESLKALGDMDVRADAKPKFQFNPKTGELVDINTRDRTASVVPVQDGSAAPAAAPASAAPQGDYGAILAQGMGDGGAPSLSPPAQPGLPAPSPVTPGAPSPRQQQVLQNRGGPSLPPIPNLTPAGKQLAQNEEIKLRTKLQTPPKNTRWSEDGTEAIPIPGTKEHVDWQKAQAGKAKVKRAAAMFLTDADRKLATLEEVNPSNTAGPDGKKGTEDDLESKVGWNTSGFIGDKLGMIPGTDAYDLKAKLVPILADEAFSALQEMRDNSPTGGALGQVTERELAMLQSKRANLDTAQSSEQLRAAIDDLKRFIGESRQRVSTAYEQDFGAPIDVNAAADPDPAAAASADQGYSQEDLEYTAQQEGKTVEQVKQELGVQ